MKIEITDELFTQYFDVVLYLTENLSINNIVKFIPNPYYPSFFGYLFIYTTKLYKHLDNSKLYTYKQHRYSFC